MWTFGAFPPVIFKWNESLLLLTNENVMIVDSMNVKELRCIFENWFFFRYPMPIIYFGKQSCHLEDLGRQRISVSVAYG